MLRHLDIASLPWQWRPFTALVITSALAWILLFTGGGPLFAIPALCTGSLLDRIPGSTQLAYALVWVSPGQLAVSWYVMILAMMLPLLAAPMVHILIRSFRSERIVNSLAFLSGYLGIWMLAGLPLIGLGLFLRLLVNNTVILFAASFSLAVVWQFTSWKQSALNKCHAKPPLAVFGRHPLLASSRFGMAYGLWCLVSCVPLMFTTLTVPGHGPAWMMIVAIWIWAERLERPRVPCFRLNLPQRAFRAVRYRISGPHNLRKFR